jgi:hypothetical protein
MVQGIPLRATKAAKRWRFRESRKDRDNVAGFGFGQTDLPGDELCRGLSGLKLDGVVIGIRANDFAVPNKIN